MKQDKDVLPVSTGAPSGIHGTKLKSMKQSGTDSLAASTELERVTKSWLVSITRLVLNHSSGVKSTYRDPRQSKCFGGRLHLKS